MIQDTVIYSKQVISGAFQIHAIHWIGYIGVQLGG